MIVFPDFGTLGIGTLEDVIGAALMLVLVVSVLMLIISATSWAIGTWGGNSQTASRGRIGVLVSLGGALMAGATISIVNVLLNYGTTL